MLKSGHWSLFRYSLLSVAICGAFLALGAPIVLAGVISFMVVWTMLAVKSPAVAVDGSWVKVGHDYMFLLLLFHIVFVVAGLSAGVK